MKCKAKHHLLGSLVEESVMAIEERFRYDVEERRPVVLQLSKGGRMLLSDFVSIIMNHSTDFDGIKIDVGEARDQEGREICPSFTLPIQH